MGQQQSQQPTHDVTRPECKNGDEDVRDVEEAVPKPCKRYHGAQWCGALVQADEEPVGRREQPRNLGLGPERRSTTEEKRIPIPASRTDVLSRVGVEPPIPAPRRSPVCEEGNEKTRLIHVMERLERLERRIEQLFELVEKAPREDVKSPQPKTSMRKTATKKTPTPTKEAKEKAQGKVSPTPKKRKQRSSGELERKAQIQRDYRDDRRDERRKAQTAKRPRSTPTCPVSVANLTTEELGTRPSMSSAEACRKAPSRIRVGEKWIPNPSLQRRLQELPKPRDPRELFEFIDEARRQREFIPDFELTVAPLTGMLGRRNRRFRWTSEATQAWHSVRATLAGQLSLSCVKPRTAYHVEAEAAEKGVKSVLFQVDPDGQRSILYWQSSTYRKTEKKYTPREKQALAVTWALRMVADIVRKEPVVLHAAEDTLDWLERYDGDQQRLKRWSTILGGFQYEVAREREEVRPPVPRPRRSRQMEESFGEKEAKMVLNSLYGSPECLPRRRDQTTPKDAHEEREIQVDRREERSTDAREFYVESSMGETPSNEAWLAAAAEYSWPGGR